MHIIRHEERPPGDFRRAFDLAILDELPPNRPQVSSVPCCASSNTNSSLRWLSCEAQITHNAVAGAQPDCPAALRLDKPALAPISFVVSTLREAADDAH